MTHLSDTPLAHIFKDCPAKWAQLTPREVHGRRTKEPALVGYVLMACASEQCMFLSCLWSCRFYSDGDTMVAWKALVNIGAVADLLDPANLAALQRFKDTYNGVMHALGKM